MQRRSSQAVHGWLINPEGSCCYRFHRDHNSCESVSLVFVDKWSVLTNGTPLQIQSRRKLPLDDALELCGQMLLDGWQKLPSESGALSALNSDEVFAA